MSMGRRGWILRAITRPPFRDEMGRKGWFERITRAQPHIVRHLHLRLERWPQWKRPLRVAYLSDFHLGSHSGDVARLERIVAEANAAKPDLALFGGDYVNLQPFGGGRIPPRTIARILAGLTAPAGRFAVLGNHDFKYGPDEISAALQAAGIIVLNDEMASFVYDGERIAIVGIPDGEVKRPEAATLLDTLPAISMIVLAHDPVWFANLQRGCQLMLAGHTHGGQVKLPWVGVLSNASDAPLRWTHGHVVENGRHLFVTSGLGTSTAPIRIGVPPEWALLEINGNAPAPST